MCIGCTPPVLLTENTGCDPRLLEPGEVRARQMPCSDEQPPGGDATRGDWLIENALLKVGVRDPGSSLTHLGVGGGTILDLTSPNRTDGILEIVPLLGGRWLGDITLSIWNSEDASGIDVLGLDATGEEHSVRYALYADDPWLYVDGADTLELVPGSGAELVGSVLELRREGESGGSQLLASDGEVEDLGGWLRLQGATRVTAGSRAEVYGAAFDGGDVASGSAQLDDSAPDAQARVWVEAGSEDRLLARLPANNGAFSGPIPAATQWLRATATGCTAGPETPTEEATDLRTGACGALLVRVVDEQGRAVPAELLWEGASFPLPSGGGLAHIGPNAGAGWITAGPAYEAQEIDLGERSGVESMGAVLRHVAPLHALAALRVPAWPDRTVRSSPGDLAVRLSARGVDYAVLIADDEVAVPTTPDHSRLHVEGGSRAASPDGSPSAWPWSQRSRRPAHGAAPWHQLDPLELLRVMDDSGSRFVLIDRTWLAAAGSPAGWDLQPTAMVLEDLDDLDAYISLLDQWQPLGAVGPLTWVEPSAAPTSAVDLEANIVDGHTVATSGPAVHLTVNSLGPGGLVDPSEPGVEVRLKVTAPEWMPLSGAALIGPGGARLAEWTASRGGTRIDEQIRLEAGSLAWVLAIVWAEDQHPALQTEPAWAVSSPVWLRRP